MDAKKILARVNIVTRYFVKKYFGQICGGLQCSCDEFTDELRGHLTVAALKHNPSMGGTLNTLLHVCAERFCWNFAATRQTRLNRILDYLKPTVYRQEVDYNLTVQDRLTILHDALDTLRPNQKKVIWYHIHGIQLRNIGAHMGFSFQRAGQLRNQALTKLKEVLDPLTFTC